MKLEQVRGNVFTLTATGQELAALVAAARLTLDGMRDDPRAPRGAVRLLERIVREYDAALAPIVCFATSAASLISSSVAPHNRAASVWKYVQ